MSDMLKNLRYYVLLVETGSYSRAAVQCGVGQPAVSKGVRKLEEEMETVLVEYREGKCVPSASGRILYEQAKEILGRYDNIRRLIQKQNRILPGRLTLVYLTFGYLNAFTPVQSGFRSLYPGIETDVRYESYARAKELLGRGEIDGFLVAAAEVGDNPHAEAVVVHRSGMIALIPKGNSLAKRDGILLSDLCNEKLVLFDPEVVPVLTGAYMEYCLNAGFTPYVAGYGRKVAEMAAKAVLNGAVALVDGTSAYAAGEGLAAVPVLGTFPKLDVCLLYHKQHASREMLALAGYCRGTL